MKLRLIYRKEALQQLASGYQTDRLFTVLTINSWIPVAIIGLLALGTVVWGVAGKIPQKVEGTGVLINPGRVRSLHGPYGGIVLDILVRNGQKIAKGDALARISQPEMIQKLQQQRLRLKELESIDRAQRELDSKRADQESQAHLAQEMLISESVKQLALLIATAEDSIEKLNRDQNVQLTKSQADLAGLNSTLQARRRNLKDLADRRVATSEQIVQAESSLVESNLRLSELSIRLSELKIKDIENKDFQFRQKSRLAELEIQRRQLLTQATQTRQAILQAQDQRRAQLAEVRDQIELLEWQIREQGELRSPFDGRLISLEIHEGQLYQLGSRAGSVELPDGGSAPPMRVMAYFSLRQGKKIRVGMKASISPTIVERERYGSIVGRVVAVSEFPVTSEGAANMLGNPELVKALAQPGGMIEAEVELERADTASGFRWTSAGPTTRLTPGTAATIHVTTEERAPISFVIPLLRSLSEGSDGGK